MPNGDHSLKETDALETLVACYNAVITEAALPRFSWKSDGGGLRVLPLDKPAAVKLWQATNPAARDFRLQTIGRAWTATDLSPQSDGSYFATVEKPDKGWTAYLVELTFTSKDAPAPFKFTTEVKVIPNVLPFKFTPKGRPATAGVR